MNKKLYDCIPFVGLPLLMLLCEAVDNWTSLPVFPYILCGSLLLFSGVMGFFSPSRRTFDYWMTAIMPVSLFCCLFVAGFLEKDDLETRFNLYKAVKAAFQPIALQLYLSMAAVTFLASFKGLRKIMSKR